MFQARVPAGLEIDQRFINGQRQWMARFPNPESGEGLNVFDTWKLDHKAKPDPARNPLAPERIARWADPAGAYFHAMHPSLWGGTHWPVTGKKPDGSLAMEGGTQNNRGSAMHGVYRMGAKATASPSLSDSNPASALDGTGAKRWRVPQAVKSAWLDVELKQPAAIGAFGLDEPDVWPRLNQKFTLEALVGGEWQKMAEGNTVGNGQSSQIAPITAQECRLTIECEKGSPGMAELQLYRAE